MFDGLFEQVDKGFERKIGKKKYLLAYKNNPGSLFLFDMKNEESVWEREVPYTVWSAGAGGGGIYVGTRDGGVYIMKNGEMGRISDLEEVYQLILRRSGMVALSSNELVDLSSGEKVKIDAPGMETAYWVFSDGEKDYLHYTIKHREFVITEIDLETGKAGEGVFRAECKNYWCASQTEKVGDWLLTAGENKRLVVVKELGKGWKLKRGLHATSGDIRRFVIVGNKNTLDIYAGGVNEFVRVVSDKNFEAVGVEKLRERIGKPTYCFPLLALSAYEAGAYLGAEVE